MDQLRMNKNQGILQAWNETIPVRTEVMLIDDFGKVERTRTGSTAWIGGGRVVVKVDGRAGGFDVAQLIPIPVQIVDQASDAE